MVCAPPGGGIRVGLATRGHFPEDPPLQGLWGTLTGHFRCDNWAGQKPTATWRGNSHSQEVPEAAGGPRPQLHAQQQPHLEASPSEPPGPRLCWKERGRAAAPNTPGRNRNVPGTPWAHPASSSPTPPNFLFIHEQLHAPPQGH